MLSTGLAKRPPPGDVSICHPVTGAGGEWKDKVMTGRAQVKIQKHQGAYASNANPAHFTPLIATTYGVLHEDFLRTLWLVADKTLEHCHTVGEVREGPAARDYRRNIFTRLRARALAAVARQTAMRLDAHVHHVCPLVVCFIRSQFHWVVRQRSDGPASHAILLYWWIVCL